MTERRKNTRQPLQRDVRYRVRGRGGFTGRGTTLNISQSALAFVTQERLPVGAPIDVSVSWPAEAGSILRLTANGAIVRSDDGISVCTMENSTFRVDELDEEEAQLAMTA